MITRNMQVNMRDDGSIEVRRGDMVGLCELVGGSWAWNVFEEQHCTAWGGQDSQYAAYGELLCKMFELTT